MNYTKLITKKKQYKYSVNICLDLRTEERLADFIPNLTTTEIIREYLGGIIRGNSDKMCIRDREDTFRIKEYINKNHPKSAVLAGGGFIGLELAENLRECLNR